MEKNNSPSERQNVSFKFTKKVSKTMSGNKLEETVSKNTEKEFVISVVNRDIKRYVYISGVSMYIAVYN